ncbi:uncharacterized protein LOC110693074 [Chenopodium quinoa]|uniref:uncharacterized protein LOC110693074 n=1 Tax=Chenopodium quinoa TaxID=63459 RepID=UPI000B77CB84|nr:uncharacterized protein LOC110693074 [Chenopodium quinoa]
MAPRILSGPPEITIPSLPTTTIASAAAAVDKNDRSKIYLSDFFPSNFLSLSNNSQPNIIGLTENGSTTFLTSGNPALDFFFHVVPDTPASELIHLVQLSWSYDSLLTLKLICNLRGVRGTGKSDKKGFYESALWLHENHPKTLTLNMSSISGFGYLKDMPEILFRLLEGTDSRKRVEKGYGTRKRVEEVSEEFPVLCRSFRGGRGSGLMGGRGRGFGLMGGRGWGFGLMEEELEDHDVNKGEEKSEEEREKIRVLRFKKKNERTKKILRLYNRDANFRLLHDSISDVFVDLLRKDVELLKKGDLYNIGLAAKWCPTLDSTYDEVTLLCESIARGMFPKEEFDEYRGMEEGYYAFKVRDRLRKEVLVPLRKALELPEVYICAKEWDALPYNRVPSVAMNLYKGLFYKNDRERFEGYLEKVKSGKATIAAGALLPHEIIVSLWRDKNGGEVAELQWKRMVDDLAKKGKFSNCMAISDVSGSMNGIPMEVSIALGLLISELSEKPWKGKLITFSNDPQLHRIKGRTLKKKCSFVKKMDWGYSTDLQKVFDRILKVAVKAKLPQEQMIKRLFIFSDMEFNEASGWKPFSYGINDLEPNNDVISWETDYMVIQRKFKESGYDKVPEIVFWNLRHSEATPVPSTEPGVALVSGYSKNLMTLFLEEGGVLNPEGVMLAAVAKPEYDALVVYD